MARENEVRQLQILCSKVVNRVVEQKGATHEARNMSVYSKMVCLIITRRYGQTCRWATTSYLLRELTKAQDNLAPEL